MDLLKPMEDHTGDAKLGEEAARLPVSGVFIFPTRFSDCS